MKSTLIFLIGLLLSSTFAVKLKKVEAKSSQTSCAVGLTVDPVFYANGKYYIRLAKIGSGVNYSGSKVPASKPWGASDSDVLTVWSAIQLNLTTMTINTGDFTYSKSTGQCSHYPNNKFAVPYGSAFGCSGSADGSARIDLTGTPFAIADSFANGGYIPKGSATFSSNNQVVVINGGGSCGWETPSAANAAGEANAAAGGLYLKVTFLPCLVGVASIGCNGGFYLNLKVNATTSQYKVEIITV